MTDYRAIKRLLGELLDESCSRFGNIPKDIVRYCLKPYLRHRTGRVHPGKYKRIGRINLYLDDEQMWNEMYFNRYGELKVYAHDVDVIIDSHYNVSRTSRLPIADADLYGFGESAEVIWRQHQLEIRDKKGVLLAIIDPAATIFHCVVNNDCIFLAYNDGVIKKYDLHGQLIYQVRGNIILRHEIFELRDGRLVSFNHRGQVMYLNTVDCIWSSRWISYKRNACLDADDNIIFITQDRTVAMLRPTGELIELYVGDNPFAVYSMAIREDGAIYILMDTGHSVCNVSVDVIYPYR